MEIDTKISTIDGYRVLTSEYEGMFTMSLLVKGGPIISDKDEMKCKDTFKEALKVVIAVVKLVTFEKTGKWKR